MAKRVSSVTANWAFILETFSPKDKAKVAPFKSLADKYSREISIKPAELPKIDWNYYKSRISAPGMVDSFQKAYESYKIPYPSDQGLLSETEAFNLKANKNAEELHEKLMVEIKQMEEELKKKESAMRYVDMTMEEFCLARPDLAPNPDKPGLWPQALIEKEARLFFGENKNTSEA